MSWDRIEATSYWLLYPAAFLAIAAWESYRPSRDLRCSTARRWSRHGGLFLLATLVSTAVYRLSPVLLALKLSETRFGLLPRTGMSLIAQGALAIVLLDLTRYLIHRGYHAAPWLWRFHQIHHSDADFDVSTGARFHPVEVLLTQGSTLAAVAAFGMLPVAVLIFELAACFESCFVHANVALPRWLEGPLRTVFVTPDMHRIHHSDRGVEQRSNLGDVFPWWDRLFGTYAADPIDGPEHLVVGLKGFPTDSSVTVPFMLALPFRGDPSGSETSVNAGPQSDSSAG
jgi:sterol desaturase/sphingolipid hydroxylase (fatty acid hydroxylase superfamily)